MQSVSSSLDDANIVVCFNVVEIILSYKIFNNLVYLSPEAKLQAFVKMQMTHNHMRSQGVPKGPWPPKFLENIVILCFEGRFFQQNSVIRLKSNIFALPKIVWLATPLPATNQKLSKADGSFENWTTLVWMKCHQI